MEKNVWIQICCSGSGDDKRLYALNQKGEIFYIQPDHSWKKVPDELFKPEED